MNSRLASLVVTPLRIAGAVLATTLVVIGAGAHAQTLVDISSSPLFGGRTAHPNIVVSTSVEYPTVGSAYLNDQNRVAIPYLRTNTYLGYFDPTQCYVYNGTPLNGYFSPSGAANANHECRGGSFNNSFSGNFMNWVTMSAIDEFRYAMTGGNRVDENGPNNGVIVERAYLPDGSINGIPSFYAYAAEFPRHSMLTISGVGYVDPPPPPATGTPSSRASDVLPNNIVDNGRTIYITNCKTYVFFGYGGGGSCAVPDADVGQFQVRVLVCDATEGPVRRDLCLQYGGPTGRYKPVGQAQLNAANMRFAVFGYLMDRDYAGSVNPPSPRYSAPCNSSGWNTCRYGGVLRAPMKYLGPTAYDANQTASANVQREINPDGTLVTDPEGNAASAGGVYSGFLNYINKFGSTGVYKYSDPQGEMYYEALRYYEGQQPTPEATTGTITNSVKDFFPITTTWTDPILSSCSSNYIVNVSDAQTWNDTYLPGFNGATPAGDGRPASRPVDAAGLDAYLWAKRIGDLERTTPTITTDDVRTNLYGIENRPTGYYRASYLVAGAAFWANVSDIRPDLPGTQSVKTISFDVAELSLPVRDRQLYLMGKYGGFNNTIDRTTDTFANPFYATNANNPTGPAIRTNSEWEDSVGSAYPANYLLASDPQKLINGIRSAFARISSTSGTLSGAALTSANLTYGSAGAYIATFNPARWSGSVLYNSLSVDAQGNLVVSTSPIWDAGALLSARCGTVTLALPDCQDTSTSANNRKIFTTVQAGRTGLTSGIRVAKPFTFVDITAAVDASYLLALNTSPSSGSIDGQGQARLNYLRGYRADEASSLGYRARDSIMGDVINSAPVYAGPPTTAIPDADYLPFATTYSARVPAVYVGANDGMLHAFRAADGVELFSYIPGFSYLDLHDLTNPAYQHEVFVDTVPKVQEAKVGNTWKTVLVGANGGGRQGIFGLDVSDPSAFGTSNVLFEFSDADDPDFVNVTAAPEFAKLWVSGDGVNVPKVYRYFAVVTGYNNKRTTVNINGVDSNVSTDTLNKGYLFLVALDHALGTPWVQGTDYYKYTFPAANATAANGLAPVTLLASATGDRSTAAMYFGDLQGNLWKFNTYTGDPSRWASALGTPSAPLPLFVAQDGMGNRQPITARVELSNGPFGSTLVYFGTGKYLGATDTTLPGVVQSEYAILDLNQSTPITRSADLVVRNGAIVTCAPPATGNCVSVTGAAFSYTGPSAKKGWYLDFPSSVSDGERSVTKPAVRTGLLTFTTLTLSGTFCAVGNGYIYQVNALTGLPVAGANYIGYASTVGIPGPPRVVDLTIAPGQAQATGEQINLKTQTTLVSGTAGKIGSFGPQIPFKAPPTQQINWREITNWNDQTNR